MFEKLESKTVDIRYFMCLLESYSIKFFWIYTGPISLSISNLLLNIINNCLVFL